MKARTMFMSLTVTQALPIRQNSWFLDQGQGCSDTRARRVTIEWTKRFYFMPAQITNLFLLENLEDASRTRELAESDRKALRAVADWIKTFVVRPHRDLGRAGPVCPFVPPALEHKTLWLAAERSAGRSAPDIVKLIDGYKRLLLAAQPVDGDDASNKSVFVVFTDLPAAQAKDFFDGVLQQIGVRSYVDDGLGWDPSTRATKGPRYTTQTFDRSHHLCRRY